MKDITGYTVWGREKKMLPDHMYTVIPLILRAAVITLYTEDTHHHLQMDIPTAQKTIPQLSMQGKKDVLDNMYTNWDIRMLSSG